jgi:hypothetical protein
MDDGQMSRWADGQMNRNLGRMGSDDQDQAVG